MEVYEHLSRQDLLNRIADLEKQIENLSGKQDSSVCSRSVTTENKRNLEKQFGSKALEALPDMLSVLDYEGNYVELVSSEKTVHVGNSSAAMLGKNIRDILPKDAYEIIKTNLDQVIHTQTTGIACHSLPLNGEKHFFENRIIPLDDNHVLCICRDKTEAIQTQQKLEMVKSAVNNSIEEIYACTIEGNLIFANAQFYNNYHLSGDIREQKIYDIYPDITRDSWQTQIQNLREANGTLKYTTSHKNADGTSITLEITTYIVKEYDEEKEIVWTFGRNISERLQQQRKIRELNFIMDTILNNVPVYLFVKDTGNEFRYLYWNKAFEEHSGILADHALGHTDYEIFPNPEDARKFREDDLRLLTNGEKIEYQEDYMTTSGEIRTVNTIKTLVPFEDNKPPFIIGIAWDITELKNTETALIEARIKAEQSDKLKSAFLANMSHEIRTPLNAIVGFSRLIAETQDPEELRQYDDIINLNAELLLQLINDILDLSKIEAGTLEFVMKPVDLKELCQSLYNTHLHKTQSNVRLILDSDAPDMTITSDNNRLAQVISNLITNAQKFTTEGEIRFGYKQKDKNIEFFVQDTGIGIAPQNLESIFNRFVKLNNFAQGSGLGLSICQMIINNLGGYIEVESAVGKGSTFRFTIPIDGKEKTGKTPERITSIQNKEKHMDQHKVILIAEDVNSNFLLLKAMIGKEYDLVRAVNGKEAIELNKTVHPDLILMDIKMPEMDGLEATRIIRQEDKNIPIIALTAFAFESDKAEAFAAGCNDFLTKPVSIEQLKKALGKYI